MMKLSTLLLFIPLSSHAFSYQALPQGTINLSSSQQRDVYTMVEWASMYGVQQCPGFGVYSNDGKDYYAATEADIAAGTPVVVVPSELVISSSKVAEEFGGSLYDAEQRLTRAGLQDKIPMFRIYIKVLYELQQGQDSPYYTYLNSLPRSYNTGASMTFACFDCLPPYAAWLALQERQTSVNFQKAAKLCPINEEIMENICALKWAYNVALTRSHEWYGERYLAPMADMFNHGMQPEIEISIDDSGNCIATATTDVPAGSPLRMSYGDSYNPSPLFASYGFLDESAPATFCKLMDTKLEMEELGYTYSDLLFYHQTGEISPQVYDVVLYSILKKNDLDQANQFYNAVMTGDEDTKSQYHNSYWEYTKEELTKHVDGTLKDLSRWSAKAQGYDLNTHPRVPLILEHNEFVKRTFWNVKAYLDSM
ncbi:hypothetical protein ACHAXN_003643 [Cyclotella atomus]|jgi:hypothetical protein